MTKKIDVPPEIDGLIPVISISGGKDSLATCLALREAGVEGVRYVFSDTGWEHPSVYAYLDYLEAHLKIKIDRISNEHKFLELSEKNRMFPARSTRFCTQQLTVLPIKRYHEKIRDTEGETVSVVGIRRDESEARSTAKTLEDDPNWGGYVWRPIADWTVEDVLLIHHRHNVEVNPLYRLGHNRVGCYPCIFSARAEIALVAKNAPERIDEIRAWEAKLTGLRRDHNAKKTAEVEEKYADEINALRQVHGIIPTGKLLKKQVDIVQAKLKAFDIETEALSISDDPFAPPFPITPERQEERTVLERDLARAQERLKEAVPHPQEAASFFTSKFKDEGMSMGIDSIVDWANADRGGRDHRLMDLLETSDGGCYRWGLCDAADVRKT